MSKKGNLSKKDQEQLQLHYHSTQELSILLGPLVVDKIQIGQNVITSASRRKQQPPRSFGLGMQTYTPVYPLVSLLNSWTWRMQEWGTRFEINYEKFFNRLSWQQSNSLCQHIVKPWPITRYVILSIHVEMYHKLNFGCRHDKLFSVDFLISETFLKSF